MTSDNYDGGDATLPDLGDAIDSVTFAQILEMDEDDPTREFSNSIVQGFFEQAEETFEKMDTALEKEDLEELSKLGHFLKGSSATLGLTKIKDSCEKIQRYGKMEKEDGSPLDDEKVCLEKITKTLEEVKKEYTEAEKVLNDFFGTSS
ncbi:putative Hpt domain-containing protein [Seiridium cardinale]|uniref:Hpt domain-containing protein n=1 Tax=Seiridium cardinale TaxID=138064 RepID=A0ABR2XYB7_9PEZI